MKNHWLLLDRVEVSNLSNVWQEILYWPDTVLTMQNGTDIEEISSNSSLVLWQNRPNPSRYY
ncbi:MAG: hypothetical protein J5642_04345 [Bacteroidales bacterium]|nr:hypothetical protein [Bacteroidales bacterium]